MTAVGDLYRAVVLEHGKRPRNVGRLATVTHAADGDNPLCGDTLHMEVTVEGGRLTALRFQGECCMLATASASLMTEWLAGKTVEDAERLRTAMQRVCEGGSSTAAPGEPAELGAFVDVHRHPVRIQCATLPWRTLQRALAV